MEVVNIGQYAAFGSKASRTDINRSIQLVGIQLFYQKWWNIRNIQYLIWFAKHCSMWIYMLVYIASFAQVARRVFRLACKNFVLHVMRQKSHIDHVQHGRNASRLASLALTAPEVVCENVQIKIYQTQTVLMQRHYRRAKTIWLTKCYYICKHSIRIRWFLPFSPSASNIICPPYSICSARETKCKYLFVLYRTSCAAFGRVIAFIILKHSMLLWRDAVFFGCCVGW